MGCHVLDGVYWALKIEHPTSIEAEEIRGGSSERYPTGSRLRFDIPARGEMPAAKVFWYEGLNKDAKSDPSGDLRAAKGDARNFPPLLHELMKQYPDEELDKRDSGTLYVTEKGVIHTETYGNRMHVVPFETYREGKKETAASFEYGAQLTEFTLLGNLAQHAGVGKKIEWDGKAMKVTNAKELNEWLKRPYRKAWKA
jgi:hypothetical protein